MQQTLLLASVRDVTGAQRLALRRALRLRRRDTPPQTPLTAPGGDALPQDDPLIRVACMDDLEAGVDPETLFDPPAPLAPPPPVILGLSTPPGSQLGQNQTDQYAQTIKGLRERAGVGLIPDADGTPSRPTSATQSTPISLQGVHEGGRSSKTPKP